MLQRFRTFLIALFLSIAVFIVPMFAASAASVNQLPVNEEQVIRKLDQQWMSAAAKKDLTSVASFYAPDAVFMPPHAPSVTGQAICQAWTELLQRPGVSLQSEPTKIVVSEDGKMAYDIGSYTLSFQQVQEQVEDQGKYLVVWQKVRGQWQAAADIFNSNLPGVGKTALK